MKNSIIILLLVVCLIVLVVIAVRVFSPSTPEPMPIAERQAAMIEAMEKAGPDAMSSKSIESASMLAGEQELVAICNRIMTSVVNNDIPDAFTIMSKHCLAPESEAARQEDLTVKQLEIIRPRYGKMLSYELVERKIAGKSAIRYTYVAKCEKHMLRWVFWFYKPEDKWLLDQFIWDDKIDRLFR